MFGLGYFRVTHWWAGPLLFVTHSFIHGAGDSSEEMKAKWSECLSHDSWSLVLKGFHLFWAIYFYQVTIMFLFCSLLLTEMKQHRKMNHWLVIKSFLLSRNLYLKWRNWSEQVCIMSYTSFMFVLAAVFIRNVVVIIVWKLIQVGHFILLWDRGILGIQ